MGAGVLVAGKNGNGEVVVLVGRRPQEPGLKEVNDIVGRFNLVFDDCWTNPFGTMDSLDNGNFRNCAVRELVEEILEGDGKKRSAKELEPHFNHWAGLAIGSGLIRQVENSRESLMAIPFVGEFRTYFASVGKPVEQLGNPKPNLEFVPGTVGWQKPSWLVGQPRVHLGLRQSLEFFTTELARL